MGNQVSALKEPACCIIHSKIQQRKSSLKGTWVIHKGDSQTNFRILQIAGGARDLQELSLGEELLVGVTSLDFFQSSWAYTFGNQF